MHGIFRPYFDIITTTHSSVRGYEREEGRLEAHRGDVGMPEPLLHLGDVGLALVAAVARSECGPDPSMFTPHARHIVGG